jgi:hypothetical protein
MCSFDELKKIRVLLVDLPLERVGLLLSLSRRLFLSQCIIVSFRSLIDA